MRPAICPYDALRWPPTEAKAEIEAMGEAVSGVEAKGNGEAEDNGEPWATVGA